MKTWIVEIAVVWIVLIVVVYLTRGGLLEAVGALAVLAAFAHAQVAERMREREALKSKPDVHCHRWITRYFMAKELLWCSYFVAHKSWSALAGVGVFLAYPLWRAWWRRRHPLPTLDMWPLPALFINACRFHTVGRPRLNLSANWNLCAIVRPSVEQSAQLHDWYRSNASQEIALPQGGMIFSGKALLTELIFEPSETRRNEQTARLRFHGVGQIERRTL
jgi:hypothetical protein